MFIPPRGLPEVLALYWQPVLVTILAAIVAVAVIAWSWQ
jgi:hypothetical protein